MDGNQLRILVTERPAFPALMVWITRLFLGYAAVAGFVLGLARFSQSQGADANEAAQDEILYAASTGDVDRLELLLSTHARWIADSIACRDALISACGRGDEPSLELLIEGGVPVNVVTEGGMMPLSSACLAPNAEHMVQLLLDYGADPNLSGVYGMTPLHIACIAGQTAAVKLLLSHGADPSAATDSGVTPLHVACYTDNREIAALLLDAEAAVAVPDQYGQTPIQNAQSEQCAAVLDLLRERKMVN